MADIRDILEAVAKTLRKSVGPCNVYDPNVCKFTMDSEHGWQPVVVAGAPFMHEVAFSRSGRRLTLFANADFLRIEVKGERSGEVFCVGQPDRECPSRIDSQGMCEMTRAGRCTFGLGRFPPLQSIRSFPLVIYT
jgi:hypothetical protein